MNLTLKNGAAWFASLIVFCVVTSSAFAALPRLPEMDGWTGSPIEKDVRALYQTHKIVLVHDPDALFTLQDVRSFSAGADAMGPRMVRLAGAPIRFVRRPKPCLFGMGRASKGCPTFDKKGRFFIYDMPPVQGEGPVTRYKHLALDERRDLQRRRAVVHAMMTRIDETLEWSKDKIWRDINGWKNKRKSLNQDAWGYSRYLGQSSPSLDLITFAEAFFVRPQDVTNRTLDPDQSVQCQEFTRARFLEQRVKAIDDEWRGRRFPSCPEFERWANIDALDDIDLLVAAASPERPESLYGHLLIHIRYKGDSEGFEPVYQFGAVTNTNVSPIDYFSRGLLGGFSSVLEVSSFRAIDRLFLQAEQRSLKRFRLNLTTEQKRHMLQRVWEMERRYRFPYVFLRNNCASFLYDLVGPALSIHFDDRSNWIIAPTDVLDSLAAQTNDASGPLIQKRPLVAFSSREIALKSLRLRRVLMRQLYPDESKNVLKRLESKKPEVRADGVAQLMALSRSHTEISFEERLDVIYQTVQIEKYFAEVARVSKKKVAFGRLQKKPVYTAEELLARRRELYREEKLEKRYEKILEYSTEIERAIEKGPYRPPSKKEQQVLAWAEASDAAFDVAVSGMGDFISENDVNFDAVDYLSRKETAFAKESAERDERSTGPSGKGRFSAGWGYQLQSDVLGNNSVTTVGAAFIKERLGEQRRRGFRSDIESVALDANLQIPILDRAYRRFSAHVTIFRFLSATRRIGPIRRSFLDTFGWGIDTGVTHRGRRGVFGLLYGSGGLVVPLLSSDSFANFLVGGVFADVRLGQLQTTQELMGGGIVWLRAQLHLYGNYANVIALEAQTRHHVSLPLQGYLHRHQAKLETQHALFSVGQHPMLAKPYAQFEFSNFVFPDPTTYQEFQFGLSLELPL